MGFSLFSYFCPILGCWSASGVARLREGVFRCGREGRGAPKDHERLVNNMRAAQVKGVMMSDDGGHDREAGASGGVDLLDQGALSSAAAAGQPAAARRQVPMARPARATDAALFISGRSRGQ